MGKFLRVILSIVLLLSLVILPVACVPALGSSLEVPTTSPDVPWDLSYLVAEDPANVDVTGLPVTPTSGLHTTNKPPEVKIEDYQLNVIGMVDNRLGVGYDEILSYPSVTKTVLLICSGAFADNAEWTGVPVKYFLDRAGVRDGANTVTFYALDSYHKSMPLWQAEKEGVFLAYEVNGEKLPPEHGYPLRLVAEGQFGYLWTKWVTTIELTRE